MKSVKFFDDALGHQPNIRAEDGMQHSYRNEFSKYVFIPIATVLAVLLTMLGMIVLNR